MAENLPKYQRMYCRIKSFRSFITFGSTIIALASVALPCSVSMQPNSSDFGKILCGNTSFDIWGGFQPYIRVFAQLYSGKRTNPDGREVKVKPENVLGRFARGKLAPVPGALVNIAIGTNVVGEKVTLQSTAADLVTPLIVNDIMDAKKATGGATAVAAGVLGSLGVGVQSYERERR